MSVVTRFAPSPTGFLHIGGARTALFNYLLARHHGGKYLLRIEDTDKARQTGEAIDAILDGLDWLCLPGDEEPLYQSSRAERHAEIAKQLLDQGLAYRCYLTSSELGDMREDARKIGYPIRSPWRDKPAHEAPDLPYVVRLKMPTSGETTIDDLVQGKVTVAHQHLDDLIMLRSDGTPTYMLAVVADDHDMGVTYVVRGDDHLNNAFRQQKIIEMLDWPQPAYAHIPLIHGSDGAKLSKRHGALSVMEYKDMGYLPEAMNNYLLRLGWSHGNDEVISREEAIGWFCLKNIGKSEARFDQDKLTALNATYLKNLDDEKIAQIITGDDQVNDEIRERLIRLAPAIKKRAEKTDDLCRMAQFVIEETPHLSPDDAREVLTDSSIGHLKLFAEEYPQEEQDLEAIQAWFSDWCNKTGLHLREIAPALRVALTGQKQSVDIPRILYALGKSETVKRINHSLQKSR